MCELQIIAINLKMKQTTVIWLQQPKQNIGFTKQIIANTFFPSYVSYVWSSNCCNWSKNKTGYCYLTVLLKQNIGFPKQSIAITLFPSCVSENSWSALEINGAVGKQVSWGWGEGAILIFGKQVNWGWGWGEGLKMQNYVNLLIDGERERKGLNVGVKPSQ